MTQRAAARPEGPGAAAAAAAAVGLVTLLGGCGTSVATLSFPPPSPTPPVPTTVAALPDTASVVVPPVPGEPTTTQPGIRPGQASIDGTVLGPAGPVAGATVETDRIVGDQGVATEVVTGADGSFTLSGVLGGVYRVRAWQSPALAMAVPQVAFVPGTGSTQLSLTLDSYSGLTVATAMAPSVVGVGGDANLVVSVAAQVVGVDGVVRPAPVPGQAVDVISSASGWDALGADPATTGTDGIATLEVACTQIGAGPLVVTVAGATPVTVTTPSCVPAATTTTAPLPGTPGSTTVPGSTPTTTAPGTTPGSTTTTTTTGGISPGAPGAGG